MHKKDHKSNISPYNIVSVVPDEDRVMSEIATDGEYAEVIGWRTALLLDGAPPYIKLSYSDTDYKQIALKELVAKRNPFIIVRKRPCGTKVELWKCRDMAFPQAIKDLNQNR